MDGINIKLKKGNDDWIQLIVAVSGSDKPEHITFNGVKGDIFSLVTALEKIPSDKKRAVIDFMDGDAVIELGYEPGADLYAFSLWTGSPYQQMRGWRHYFKENEIQAISDSLSGEFERIGNSTS